MLMTASARLKEETVRWLELQAATQPPGKAKQRQQVQQQQWRSPQRVKNG